LGTNWPLHVGFEEIISECQFQKQGLSHNYVAYSNIPGLQESAQERMNAKAEVIPTKIGKE